MASALPRQLAVLGSPIAHSRSPQLQAAAYEVLGLDWGYGRIHCEESELPRHLHGVGPEWLGYSLTMPLKRVAFELASERDAVAESTGAVNTLRRDPENPERWLGWNTDVGGLVRALREQGFDGVSRAVILGGGATATSGVAALAALGARSLTVLVRDPRRAEEPQAVAAEAGLEVSVGTLETLDAVAEGADLVLSTLPATASSAVPATEATRTSVPLFDVAYDPWPSPLAASWAEAGGRAESGLPMLIHQALLQVRIFVHGDVSAELPDENAILEAMVTAVS